MQIIIIIEEKENYKYYQILCEYNVKTITIITIGYQKI